MQRDLGSRDFEFIEIVRDIRTRLLALGQVAAPDYAAIPMQGSGTFALEAVLASCVAPNGKILSVINGAYGRRISQIARVLGINVQELTVAENHRPRAEEVDRILAADPGITMVVMAHCETTTGIVNPVAEVGAVVAHHRRRYFVDAMSSFGAIPLDLAAAHIDYLVSSANKCIEGVPGFAFVLANQAALLATRGWARSVSFDLLAQWQALEASGQFRFTPPTHALLAFHQALLELEQEGGITARAERYRRNHATLQAGMRALGFVEYLAPADQGYIITSYRYPQHANFDFDDFYQRLNERGFVIYPGKVSDADCFRIGTIGRLFESDMRGLLESIDAVLREMGVELRRTTQEQPRGITL